MADLGNGVSYVYDNEGFDYDMVVFQKGKPPLDSELNLAQELQNAIGQRNLRSLSSGWLSAYPPYADRSLAPSTSSTLANSFYTQNPTGAKPEFALVNGQIVYVTNTASSATNVNLIDLGTPPTTVNRVNGVILETWRALIDPSTTTNKPDPATVIDILNDIYMLDSIHGWICGTNGLILTTTNGGATWPVIGIDTKRSLNGIHFYNSSLGWVVGDNGVVARSASGGAAWTLLTPATTVNLNSVCAVSQTVVWAVGDNGVLLKASNGVTFVPVSSNVTNNLNEVYFSDINHGWIVGDNGLILKTTNGGVTWSSSASGTTNNLNSAHFYNINFGFAVGDNGTILQSSNGGITWINQSANVAGGAVLNNLNDVNLFPKLDDVVTGEEVSSQLGSTGNSFTTMHFPISTADGKGIITNNPADVTVTVNGTKVTVLNVNGLSGVIVLAAAPGIGAVTKIDYHYQFNCAVFQGKAWIVGDTGLVLSTSDIGATWTSQDPASGYDLKAVSFISQTNGWLSGAESVIRFTTNSGSNWTPQTSDIFARQVQRIFNEGNVETAIYLDENSIHPDAQIVTTKRVQLQYRIRTLEAVDPLSNPEAGLSSSIMGQGPNSPNSTGAFGYENMGPINGDYGCWRAKCLNTVDGYVYAIPMFFVARRNSTAYSNPNNLNGQHIKNTSNIRPDLLLATNVVMDDILDVRRKVLIPSTEELFHKTFDAMMANTLQTNMGRSSAGDQYGTSLLYVDTITGASIGDAALGLYSSDSTFVNTFKYLTATPTLPAAPTTLDHYSLKGIFHPDPSFSEGIYNSTTPGNNGRRIPGQFHGLGTSDASFVYNDNVLTITQDSFLSEYDFYAKFIGQSSSYLTFAPTNPQLVINSSGTTPESFIYQGVLDTAESKVIEAWDSGLTGYQNYAVAYSAQDSDSTAQQNRASSVEVHYFMRVDATNLSSGNLLVPMNIIADPDSSAVPYIIKTIRQVYNRTSGFSHKVSNVNILGPTNIKVTPLAGYEFISSTVLEVVAAVVSAQSLLNTRNGATVNFNTRLRNVNKFIYSKEIDVAGSSPYSFSSANDLILGWSTTETAGGLNQAIAWNTVSGNMQQVTAVPSSDLATLTVTSSFTGTLRMQLLLQKTVLDFQATTDALNIAYRYNPYQGLPLSSSLTVEPISGADSVYVSTAGSGGGPESYPYTLPLEHIPTVGVSNDLVFSNYAQMNFANYMADNGFVQLPVNIPGNFYGSEITLSSPLTDPLTRAYYSNCSRELKFQAEGLQLAVPRKVYVPILTRVTVSNALFIAGEYVLLVFSRPILSEKENVTGYFPNGDCSISAYRISGRPISRI